ncbi:hypothetical protein J3R82DRAFT_2907 [Butyriboletus roseoflavus]|nr:hypothetical protein J3R82DRAFT_2907 [Butyriboletus roseoflavus]
MNVNDTIKVYAVIDSPTFGEVYMQNEASGQVVRHNFTSSAAHPLCEESVAWMVSIDINAANRPLANFTQLEMTSASASDSNGVLFRPDGANLVDMVNAQTQANITFVQAFVSTLFVTYI